MSNYSFIVCIVFDEGEHMSPRYNILPEAACCCLLVVYKHVTMTSFSCDYGYQHTHKISSFDIALFLSYGCRTRRRRRRRRK